MNRVLVILGVVFLGLFGILTNLFLAQNHLKAKRLSGLVRNHVMHLTSDVTTFETQNKDYTTINNSYKLDFNDVRKVNKDLNDYVMPEITYLKEPTLNTSDECIGVRKIDWHMVFFIKSTARNYVRRELLRRTWASLSYVDGARFDTVFVVGNPPDGNRELLNEESMRYRDILQYDGPDDYKNVVLKTLAGMQWSSSRLPSSAFYSSGDDDFLVNLLLLKQLVDDNIQTWHDKSWPEFPLVCSYGRLKAETPVRDKGYKCTMSVEEYKWPRYPKTCLGGLYTTSVNVIKQLFQIARTTKPIKLDDVWVTGLLRHKIGMPDEMVVENELNVAKHYSGFAKLETESKRDFMTKEWIPIFDSLKNASICRKL